MGTAGSDQSQGTRIADLLRAYCEADYRWEIGGQWHPLAVGQPAPRLEEAFPSARRFGLVSAWNPQSVIRADAANRAADDELHALLREGGCTFRPGFSAARNRSWREPSWLVVDMPLPEFDAITRRFDQLATLAWRAGGPVGLRMHAERPAGVPVDGSVAWLGAPGDPAR